MLPSDGFSEKPISAQLYWLLFSVPLFSLVYTLYEIAKGQFGRSIVFDGVSRTIFKASRKLANFLDVEKIDIREIETNQGKGEVYQLSICLKTAPTLVVATSDDYDTIAGVATDLSNVLNLKITKSSNKNDSTILDWNGPPAEPKIKLPYSPNSLSQVLRWGLHSNHSHYTHQDIAEWCDNFYCEYLDTEVPPEIERLMPVLAEIREQWDKLLEMQSLSAGGNAIQPKHLDFPAQRLNYWLLQIKV